MYYRVDAKENEKMASEWIERRKAETKSYEMDILQLGDEIDYRRATLNELQQEVNMIIPIFYFTI